MPHWRQIILYGRERGEAFLARAHADARARFGPAPRVVERRASAVMAVDCEPAVAVYVEARFPGIVAAYEARGVPVRTEHDLSEEPRHDTQENRQAAAPQGDHAAEGDRTGEALARPIPIAAARYRRRRAGS